jgi:lipopolysaccharide biosynthesis glycosyltransferase
MNKILLFACDDNYFHFAKVFLRTFTQHNQGWRIICASLGINESNLQFLTKYNVEVKDYPREDGCYPATKCRCMMLGEYPDNETLMLYIDIDSVVMGSVDCLVNDFLASGKKLGISIENDDRFYRHHLQQGWHTIPGVFNRTEEWRYKDFRNSGVILAYGEEIKKLGHKIMKHYDEVMPFTTFGEQSIIASFLEDERVPIYEIPWHYHCFQPEEYIEKKDYLNPIFLDGKQVVIRHFAGNVKPLNMFPLDQP